MPIHSFISNLSEELSNMWNTLSHLSGPQISEMICSVVGSLATDVLLIILTAGAASGRLGPVLAKLMLKIQKIVAVLRLTLAMPIRMLGEFTEEALDRVMGILRSSQKERFEADLRRMGCAI